MLQKELYLTHARGLEVRDYAFNRITIILKITTNLLVTVETVFSFIKRRVFVFWI